MENVWTNKVVWGKNKNAIPRALKMDDSDNLKVNSDFLFDVSNWKVSWQEIWSIIWINPNINISGWDQQVVAQQWWQYNFPSIAVPFYISSTNISDTANTFLLTLLDWDYNEVKITVTPNGRNAVLISWWNYLRINSAQNISSNASQWSIYISTSPTNTLWVPPVSTVLWKIPFENYGNTDSNSERLHNWVFTIPAWKTWYAHKIRAWLWKNKDAVIFIYLTPFWWVPFLNIRYQLYEGNFENNLDPLIPIPEKTDIEFRATTENNATELTVNASYRLVDNDII